jgi:hypothetical protein
MINLSGCCTFCSGIFSIHLSAYGKCHLKFQDFRFICKCPFFSNITNDWSAACLVCIESDEGIQLLFKSKLFYDPWSVDQSILVPDHHLEPAANFYVSPRKLFPDTCVYFRMERPLWREIESVIYSYNCHWAFPALSISSPSPSWIATICYSITLDWFRFLLPFTARRATLVVFYPVSTLGYMSGHEFVSFIFSSRYCWYSDVRRDVTEWHCKEI